jgi:hypothetical protein
VITMPNRDGPSKGNPRAADEAAPSVPMNHQPIEGLSPIVTRLGASRFKSSERARAKSKSKMHGPAAYNLCSGPEAVTRHRQNCRCACRRPGYIANVLRQPSSPRLCDESAHGSKNWLPMSSRAGL